MSLRSKLDILIFLMKLKRHAMVYMNESLRLHYSLKHRYGYPQWMEGLPWFRGQIC